MLSLKRAFQILLLTAVATSGLNAGEPRLWTKPSTGQTVFASLVDADFDRGIAILTVDGESLKTAKIADLSDPDKSYLQSICSHCAESRLINALAGPVTVRGTVTDGSVAPPNQNGIPRVIVRATNETTNIVIASTQTDANGSYSFQIPEQPSGETVLIEFIPERGFDFGSDNNLKGELTAGSEQEINKVLQPLTVIAQSSAFELENAIRSGSALPSARSVRSVTRTVSQSAQMACESYTYKTVRRRCGLFGLRSYCVRVCVPICRPTTCSPYVGAVPTSPNIADAQSPIFEGKDAKRELKRIFDNLQFIEEAFIRSELADDEATFNRGTVVRDRILQYLEYTNGLPGIARTGTPMYDTVNEKLNRLRSSYGLKN